MSAGILRKAGFSRVPIQAMAAKEIAGQRSRRAGRGTSVVWFRNDLRVADNEALLRAWQSSSAVLPVYVLDPRLFGTTHVFKFPKTGGKRVLYIAFAKLRISFIPNLFRSLCSQIAEPSSFAAVEVSLISLNIHHVT